MRKLIKAIALLMTLAMLAGIALTEGIPEMPEVEMDLGTPEGVGELEIDDGALPEFEAEGMPDGSGIDLDVGNLDPVSDATYIFIVDDEVYATQAARAGEEILRPRTPEAPRGKAFAGWTLADGSPLFVDADRDGQIDPVTVRESELGTEVYVWAVFTEAEAEEAPADEPAEEPAEEPVDDPADDPAEQPADGQPQPANDDGDAEEAEPSAGQEPSHDGEGGGAAALTDEVPGDPPVANALTYTGEAQALVSAGEGWLFSTDGETYAPDIPTAVDAGEYTVYFKAAEDAEAQSLAVAVAKADVVLIPPEAMGAEE